MGLPTVSAPCSNVSEVGDVIPGKPNFQSGSGLLVNYQCLLILKASQETFVKLLF